MSRAVELHRVLDGIGRVAIAVSGGVDSMTLAELTAEPTSPATPLAGIH